MTDRKSIPLIIAALLGSQWLWFIDTLRCGTLDNYRYGVQDIVVAVLFVIIVWAFPAVVSLVKDIRKAVK